MVLNLPNYERDKESAIEFCFVGMCDAPKAYFDFRHINTSLWFRFINLSVLDVDWFITWPIDMLATRNKRFEFANWLYHKMRATTTGKISKKVRSIYIEFLLLFNKYIKGLSCPLMIIQYVFRQNNSTGTDTVPFPLLSYFHF